MQGFNSRPRLNMGVRKGLGELVAEERKGRLKEKETGDNLKRVSREIGRASEEEKRRRMGVRREVGKSGWKEIKQGLKILFKPRPPSNPGSTVSRMFYRDFLKTDLWMQYDFTRAIILMDHSQNDLHHLNGSAAYSSASILTMLEKWHYRPDGKQYKIR